MNFFKFVALISLVLTSTVLVAHEVGREGGGAREGGGRYQGNYHPAVTGRAYERGVQSGENSGAAVYGNQNAAEQPSVNIYNGPAAPQ